MAQRFETTTVASTRAMGQSFNVDDYDEEEEEEIEEEEEEPRMGGHDPYDPSHHHPPQRAAVHSSSPLSFSGLRAPQDVDNYDDEDDEGTIEEQTEESFQQAELPSGNGTTGRAGEIGSTMVRRTMAGLGATPLPTLPLLETGSWWFKFTCGKTLERRWRAHPRYVRLDSRASQQQSAIAWGRSDTTWSLFRGSILLSSIRPPIGVETITDSAAAYVGGTLRHEVRRVFYVMRIVSTGRAEPLVLATEMREKFDTWYDALTHLT